jgi:hypothetical protein
MLSLFCNCDGEEALEVGSQKFLRGLCRVVPDWGPMAYRENVRAIEPPSISLAFEPVSDQCRTSGYETDIEKEDEIWLVHRP